jgi:hypothetical protein
VPVRRIATYRHTKTRTISLTLDQWRRKKCHSLDIWIDFVHIWYNKDWASAHRKTSTHISPPQKNWLYVYIRPFIHTRLERVPNPRSQCYSAVNKVRHFRPRNHCAQNTERFGTDLKIKSLTSRVPKHLCHLVRVSKALANN